MEQMNIKSLLRSKQTLLESKLDVLINHPVTKGDHCEGAWIDFFRSFLPSKYAVDKGFVFDSKEAVSEQIDIIIYDALYSPLIFETDAGEKFITVESVYAVFDSKQKIDKETVEYTNRKIESVVNLHRTSRRMVVAGRGVSPRDLPPILGGILAATSAGWSTVESYVKDNPNIDIGCAVKSGSFLVKRDPERNFLSMLHSEPEEAVLAFFYMILDELYKLGTVPAIDIRDYANATLTNVRLKTDEENLQTESSKKTSEADGSVSEEKENQEEPAVK